MQRIVRNRAPKKANRDKLDQFMEAYADAEAALSVASRRLDEAKNKIFEEMTKTATTEYVHDNVKVEKFRPAGRESNIIDPQGYRKLCKSDKDFYAAVKVSITEARKIIPMRQLDTITTTIESKPGAEQVKVTVLR